ncbi:MAG: F0F1 ATP synthase subunit epsilon [Candidatus Dadabacteria bacterium]|nr:F0F1 ATP synthase subunit epsilon [Candidatus Dadabacteria bacterium]MCY4042816.1 F0F1 ATP synthase subunit epsilon [Candidatus Dadabacteria bacterium]
MSGQTLTLRVITPSGLALEERVSTVVLKGDLGEFGILAGHVPMVSTIVEGEMRYEGSGGSGSFIARGGITEVRDDTVTVLTKAVESPGDGAGKTD